MRTLHSWQRHQQTNALVQHEGWLRSATATRHLSTTGWTGQCLGACLRERGRLILGQPEAVGQRLGQGGDAPLHQLPLPQLVQQLLQARKEWISRLEGMTRQRSPTRLDRNNSRQARGQPSAGARCPN